MTATGYMLLVLITSGNGNGIGLTSEVIGPYSRYEYCNEAAEQVMERFDQPRHVDVSVFCMEAPK